MSVNKFVISELQDNLAEGIISSFSLYALPDASRLLGTECFDRVELSCLTRWEVPGQDRYDNKRDKQDYDRTRLETQDVVSVAQAELLGNPWIEERADDHRDARTDGTSEEADPCRFVAE